MYSPKRRDTSKGGILVQGRSDARWAAVASGDLAAAVPGEQAGTLDLDVGQDEGGGDALIPNGSVRCLARTSRGPDGRC
jgi:hypothetical protein